MEKKKISLSLNETGPVITGDSVTFAADRQKLPSDTKLDCTPVHACMYVKKKRGLIPTPRFEFSRWRAHERAFYFTLFYFIPPFLRARARARGN